MYAKLAELNPVINVQTILTGYLILSNVAAEVLRCIPKPVKIPFRPIKNYKDYESVLVDKDS